jgi:Raf kinase inhibitor-like YbhB/YbcL family protein
MRCFNFVIFMLFFSLIACSTTKIEDIHNNQIDDFLENEKKIDQVMMMKELKITSTAFGYKEMIPAKYTCDGDDINPPLTIQDIPQEAVSLVLINDDPDAPVGNWDHWIVFNIPITSGIQEDSVPGTQGQNSWNRNEYGGPCPPSSTHRYFFKVYALNNKLNLQIGATKSEVELAMKDMIIAKGELIGVYSRT